MTDIKRNDDMLDDMFSQMRAGTDLAPSDDLMTRVLADAATMQPASAPIATPVVPARRPFLQSLLAAIGGWPAVTGLATAGVAGVWIGMIGGETLINGDVTSLLSGTETYLTALEGGIELTEEES